MAHTTKYINIRVNTNEDVVEIIVEEVHFPCSYTLFPDNLETFVFDYVLTSESDEYVILHDIKNLIHPSLSKKINEPISSSRRLTSNNSNVEECLVCTTFTFELPKIPHLSIYLLCLINIVLKEVKTCYFFLNDPITGEEQLKPTNPYRHFQTLLSLIITKINSCENYKDTYHKLSIVTELHRTEPFIRAYDFTHQDQYLYNGIGTLVLNESIPLFQRTFKLLSYAQHLIREGQGAEANYVISFINLMAKRNLFKLCLSQTTYSGHKLTTTCKQWNFLREANFNLLKDGRIGIDVTQSNTYLRLHAQGKESTSTFENEILTLVKLLNLQLDIDTDFTKAIIFTKDCSNQLKNLGIHLNSAYIKKLIAQKNHTSIFKQAYRSTDNNLLLEYFPLEVAEVILQNLHPEVEEHDSRGIFDYIFSNRI